LAAAFRPNVRGSTPVKEEQNAAAPIRYATGWLSWPHELHFPELIPHLSDDEHRI
jgi:hypothetical protein